MPSPELIRLGVREWSEQMAGVTGEQVRQGLDQWNEDWPPSCAEFKKICVGSADTFHQSGAYKLFTRLPKPAINEELGSKCLADIKSKIATQ